MNYYKSLAIILLLSIFTPIYTFACGYSYVSQCSDFLRINANGSIADYNLADCTYRNSFQNKNFGTVQNLSITLAELITWESCENNVMEGHLYYRIYQTGSTPGGFNDFSVNNIISQSTGTYRTKRRNSVSSLNLLSGLSGGSYVFECYIEADVDSNTSGTVNDYLTTDNNGSYYQAYFTIEGGSTGGGDLTVSFQNRVNVSCRNGNDGSATAVGSGSGPYSYAWSNGNTTSTAMNLTAGQYSVTVTNSQNATGVGTISVQQPSALLAGATGGNGTATSNPSGGTPPYTYAWSNNSGTSATINNVSAGTYTVTVTDSRNCTASQNAIVTSSNTGGGGNGGGGSPSGYCASSGVTPWAEWITNVNFAGINNNSTKAHYTNFSQTATVTQGDSYLMTIENDYSWFTHNEYFRVWIDYNQNGTFESSELAFSSSLAAPPAGSPGGQISGSIQIPANATVGTTRMRVSMKRGSYATACEAIPNGEVEDYSVTIEQGSSTSPCSISANAENITCDNAGTIGDPSDDTFSFGLNVNGTDTGNGWIATYNGTTVTGSYGIPVTIGPFPISAGNVQISARDNQSSSCTASQTVSPPSTCSEAPVAGEENCSSSSNFPWFDWISDVSIGSISQSSSKSPYSDFTGVSTNIARGSSASITLTAGFSWFTNAEHWAVWIDYNQDGIFDEGSELAFSSNFPAPANGTLSFPTTGQISIPSSATLGSTRMRVTLKRDAAPTACEEVPFGEVEDYTINITGGGNGFAVNHVLRLEVNEVEENADINFYGLIPAEMIAADIEKSYDGSSYFTLSENSPEEFGDNSIYLREMDYELEKGNNYYRVKVTAGDGSVLYSNPQLVYFEPKPDFTLYPNPAQDFVMVDLPKMNGERVDISIVSQFGQVLTQETIDVQDERAVRVSTSDLIDGLYFVRVQIEGKRALGKPLMIFRL